MERRDLYERSRSRCFSQSLNARLISCPRTEQKVQLLQSTRSMGVPWTNVEMKKDKVDTEGT